MNVMLGISAAGGIGIGKVFILPESQELVIPQNKISSEDVAEEWKRFEDAVEDVQEEIESHQKSLGSGDLPAYAYGSCFYKGIEGGPGGGTL